MAARRTILIPVCALIFAVPGCPPRNQPVGQPCENEDSCAPDTTCAAVHRAPDGTYLYECIELCTFETGYRCPNGELCWMARADRPELLGCLPGGTVPLGGRCEYIGDCERGLTCDPVDLAEPAEGICAPGCTFGPCWEGEPCRDITSCDVGLACVQVRPRADGLDGECIPECTLAGGATAGLCPDGRACVPIEDRRGIRAVCIPGGERSVGAHCESSIECVAGAVCVTSTTGATECALACDDGSDCPSTTACIDSHCE